MVVTTERSLPPLTKSLKQRCNLPVAIRVLIIIGNLEDIEIIQLFASNQDTNVA